MNALFPSNTHGRMLRFVMAVTSGRLEFLRWKDSSMLALSRGEGQSIIIDGRIEVKIVKWSRSSVRLAIQAPREVTVDRDEIWRKMHAGQLTPLEKAEVERRERFAREGGVPPPGPGTAGNPPTTPPKPDAETEENH